MTDTLGQASITTMTEQMWLGIKEINSIEQALIMVNNLWKTFTDPSMPVGLAFPPDFDLVDVNGEQIGYLAVNADSSDGNYVFYPKEKI